MSDKYYVKTSEVYGRNDFASPCFHQDTPFDNLDDAKRWTLANPGEGSAIIYQCRENVLKPILIRDSRIIDGWEAVE